MKDDNLYRPEVKLDADLQAELDQALGGMSLEQIVDADTQGNSNDKSENDKLITGTVISVQGDDIFVDIGGRSEGVLPASQFRDEPLPEEGSQVEVQIDGYDSDGLLRLSRENAVQDASWDTLEVGQVVEGRVTGLNKGGLELLVNNIRAFMPISQIDTARIEDSQLDGYLNQKLECIATQVDQKDRNLVVSRRALIKQKQQELAGQLWEKLEEGQILEGTVRNIMPYGAFVDIGGADGLLHVQDMAWSRVEKPEDIVSVGDKVTVKVVSVDREKKKIGLGLKQTQSDPWQTASANFSIDSIITGTVVKLMDFGAFVEVAPGVEGLIPISELAFRRVGHPKEILSVGDSVKIRVISIDPTKKRMSLSLKQAQDDPWVGASVRFPVESTIEGPVTRITDFGAFVELAPGVEGLCHISQLSDKRVTSVKSIVQPGKVVSARVLSVDEGTRRISLTMRKEMPKQEEQHGTMEDLNAVNDKKTSKKNLKGGLDAGKIDTPFGELRLG